MPNDNTHTLKPCPNPHCERKELRKGASYMQNWRIECGSCGLSGPRAGTYDLAAKRWNDFVAAMNTRTPADPKAGDWEKEVEIHTAVEIHDRFQDDGIGDTEYVRLDEARALSSAALRITEEMVERLPRGFYDAGDGYFRFDDELVFRKDVLALLRQQSPFTPTQTEE